MRAMSLAAVREKWGWISAGLREVIDRAGAEFIPEDVFHEVMSQRSTVFSVNDANGDEVAFAVVNKVQYPHKAVLFVWVLWGEAGPVQDQLMSDLEELARSIGACEIECRSRRKGWARKGFEAGETIYRRKVTNG